MIARTAAQWLCKNPLDNVHSDEGGDFSEVERIKQTGAIVIGTYDRFSYGEPKAFIELINSHTMHPEANEVIFVEGTGHIYTKREQALADIILRLVKKKVVSTFSHSLYIIIMKNEVFKRAACVALFSLKDCLFYHHITQIKSHHAAGACFLFVNPYLFCNFAHDYSV